MVWVVALERHPDLHGNVPVGGFFRQPVLYDELQALGVEVAARAVHHHVGHQTTPIALYSKPVSV